MANLQIYQVTMIVWWLMITAKWSKTIIDHHDDRDHRSRSVMIDGPCMCELSIFLYFQPLPPVPADRPQPVPSSPGLRLLPPRPHSPHGPGRPPVADQGWCGPAGGSQEVPAWLWQVPSLDLLSLCWGTMGECSGKLVYTGISREEDSCFSTFIAWYLSRISGNKYLQQV